MTKCVVVDDVTRTRLFANFIKKSILEAESYTFFCYQNLKKLNHYPKIS